MKELNPRGRALLDAYREESEHADQPDPSVLERIEASIEERGEVPSKRRLPRAAAVVLVVGATTAAAVLTAIAWPRLSPPPVAAEPSPSVGPEQVEPPSSARAPRARVDSPVAPAEPPVAEPAREVVRSAKPSRAPQPSSLAVSEPEAPDGLQQELALLRRARRFLREGSAAQAVSVLMAHQRTYPTGQLAEERDALLVVARCKTGRPNTGRAAFEAAHPGSHHLSAIRAACAKKTNEP